MPTLDPIRIFKSTPSRALTRPPRVTYSTADQVERAVDRVKHTILEGAFLTVLIVFLFLHSWRSDHRVRLEIQRALLVR